MRLTHLIPLLPVLVASSAVSPQPASSPDTTVAEPTPSPTTAPSIENLDLREIVTAPAPPVVTAIPQYPTITHQWVETRLPNGQKTWVEVIYTQTFAQVPDQLPSPVAGEIGLGTLTGGKVGVATRAAQVANGSAGMRRVWGSAVVGVMGLMTVMAMV